MSVSAGFVQRMLDQSADGCVVFDARGLLLYANDSAKAFIAEGTTFAEVLPGAGALDAPLPEFHCPKHGLWLEVSAVRVAELHVFTLRDVTSRVEARREAERATKHLRFISDATAVLSTALDAEHTLQRVAQIAVPFLADACAVNPPAALVIESRRLVVPLTTAAGALGSLALTREEGREPFDGEDLRVAQELAGRASTAIHNAELYAALERQRADTERLQAFTAALARAATAKEVAAATVRDARPLALAEGAAVFVVRDGALVEVAREGAVALPSLEVLRAGAPRVEGASVFVPLPAQGVLALQLHRPRDVRDDELKLLATVGELVAQALVRTRLYSESQRAQRELTESLRVRDDFLAIAGHELKTPLTTARLQAGMLLRADLPERAARHAQSLTRQCERLMHLVEGLLDVSRIVAGKLSLQPQEIDLARLVTEAATRQAADNAAAAIRVVAPDSIIGKWDPLRVEQVVQNLLSNAVKYGGGNPVEVTLEAADRFATVRVRDRGIGIAPGDQRRIFERFERAAPARNYGGLGLGLWICRELTEAMGGQISVDSRPGEGSTFAVTLPR